MNKRINVPNWYQLDFDISSPRKTLEDISELMNGLIKQNLIDKWFYLFEGKFIRVRMHTLKHTNLEQIIKKNAQKKNLTISSQLNFERYWETTDTFEDVAVVETFAEIMSSLTSLTVSRLKGKEISNYRLVERISHCIFNNVYGLPTEEYFLLKRLLERYGGRLDGLNDNPEQTVLDKVFQIVTTQNVKVTLPILKVPTK